MESLNIYHRKPKSFNSSEYNLTATNTLSIFHSCSVNMNSGLLDDKRSDGEAADLSVDAAPRNEAS